MLKLLLLLLSVVHGSSLSQHRANEAVCNDPTLTTAPPLCLTSLSCVPCPLEARQRGSREVPEEPGRLLLPGGSCPTFKRLPDKPGDSLAELLLTLTPPAT